MVALDGSGRVRALIGGVSYADSQFDRAVDARRQAGSAWKPFVYLTALENGRTPDTVMTDEPVTIDGWSPHNYEPGYLGPVTLAQALQRSINTVAAKLADEVGRDKVADTARRLGITSPINTDPAMALGTSQVSPLEMATAYDAFANGGYRVAPYAIERIRTRDGQVLYQHPAPPPRPGGARAAAQPDRLHDARRAGPARHWDARGHPRLRPRRQDRHHQRFPRRLVRRLHRRLRGGGMGRQGRRHADAPRRRRHGPCRPLAPVHGLDPAPPEGPGYPHGPERPWPLRPRRPTPSATCSATPPASARGLPTTMAATTRRPPPPLRRRRRRRAEALPTGASRTAATATPTATAARRRPQPPHRPTEGGGPGRPSRSGKRLVHSNTRSPHSTSS